MEALRTQVEDKAPPVVDDLGKAKRIQLRVAGELLLQLAVIKMAEGGSSKKFWRGGDCGSGGTAD